MTRKRKRLWALLLIRRPGDDTATGGSVGRNKTPEDGAVASFAALPDTVKAQTVPTGTEESELLGLPKELTAEVYRVTETPAAEDTGILDIDGREDETGRHPRTVTRRTARREKMPDRKRTAATGKRYPQQRNKSP